MAYYNNQPQASTSATRDAPSFSVLLSNMPSDVTEDDLAELFMHEAGNTMVSVRILHNERGSSLGMALASFTKLEAAQQMITRYTGESIDGRPMQVQLVLQPGVAPREPSRNTPQPTRELINNNNLPQRPETQRKSLMSRIGPSSGGLAPPARNTSKAAVPKKFQELTPVEKKAVLAARQAVAAKTPRKSNKAPGASLLARIAPAPGAARSKATKQRINKNQSRMDVD